ncbi:MAG: FtsW/RodA/SpoVE family cell cycle protein [Chlamydiota bacterium]|nr:FtsW/RodA/SpoVE family cell cycle protein [Chlamydiota bacterium]
MQRGNVLLFIDPIGLLLTLFLLVLGIVAVGYAEQDLMAQQVFWSFLGIIGYIACSAFDYRKLQQYAWPLYFLTICLLIGLFFTPTIRHVHRWYRLSFLGVMIQPTDYAKVSVIVVVSLLASQISARHKSTLYWMAFATFLPMLLIARQPDLGSALIFPPVMVGMIYLAGIAPRFVRWACAFGSFFISLIGAIFLEIIPYDRFRGFALLFLKDYQIARLSPRGYHQQVANSLMAEGGWWGKVGVGRDLPAAHTDSIFPLWVGQHGCVGGLFLLVLLCYLIYRQCKVVAVARDPFGRILGGGITCYFLVHVLFNIGMMLGMMPISGVPLPLISYGGSSLISMMCALGILQSIYARRFIF